MCYLFGCSFSPKPLRLLCFPYPLRRLCFPLSSPTFCVCVCVCVCGVFLCVCVLCVCVEITRFYLWRLTCGDLAFVRGIPMFGLGWSQPSAPIEWFLFVAQQPKTSPEGIRTIPTVLAQKKNPPKTRTFFWYRISNTAISSKCLD